VGFQLAVYSEFAAEGFGEDGAGRTLCVVLIYFLSEIENRRVGRWRSALPPHTQVRNCGNATSTVFHLSFTLADNVQYIAQELPHLIAFRVRTQVGGDSTEPFVPGSRSLPDQLLKQGVTE
jgi:hypothetical protein